VALPVGARSRSAARRGAKQLSRFAPAARRAAAQAGLTPGAPRAAAAAAGAAAHGLTAAPGNQAALDGRPSADAAVVSSGARQPRWALRAEGAADRAAAPAAAPQPPWRTGAAAAAHARAAARAGAAGCAPLVRPPLAGALLARGWEPGGHMQGAAAPAPADPCGAPAASAPLPCDPAGKENAAPLPLTARGPAGAPRAGAQACERGPSAPRAEVRALAARLLALRRRDPGPSSCHGLGGAPRAPADAARARLPAAVPAAALARPPAGARAGADGAGSLPSAGRAAAEARAAGAGCPAPCNGDGAAALATRACEQRRPSGAAGGALPAMAAHAAAPGPGPAKRCSGQGGSGGGASASASRDSSVGAECGGGAIPSTERSSTSGAHDGGAVGHRAGATAPRGAPSAACAASAAREDSGAGGQCYGGSRACGEAGCGRQGGEAAGACDHPRAGSGVFAGVRAALDPRLPVDHVAMCAPALLNPRALCVAKTGSTRACVSAMVIALGLGTARAPLEPAPGAPLRPSLE